MTTGWRVELDGVTLSGSDAPGVGALTVPPDGLGLPGLRTEDVTYPQRDGVRHFDDWYEPRIITLTDVVVHRPGCCNCPELRQQVRSILRAWSRRCDDVELVIWPDCESPAWDADKEIVGPFGIVGRPRVAEVEWSRSNEGRATLLLRFDAVDHRIYLLDRDGTPGSGVECVTLTPESRELARCYPRCYTGGGGGGPETVLRTNLHPNPFVGGEGAPEQVLATNMVLNPSFTNDVAGWSAYAGVSAPTWDPAGVLSATGNGTNTGVAVKAGAGAWPVSPGDTVHVRARVRMAAGQTPTASLVRCYFGGGAIQLDDRALGTPDADGWYDATGTFTAPPETDPGSAGGCVVYLGLRLPADGTPSDVLQVDQVIASVEDVEFFDGDTLGADGVEYRWTGVPNASPSEKFIPTSAPGSGWTLEGRGGVTQTLETEGGPLIDGRTVPWRKLTFAAGSGDPVIYSNGDGSPWFPLTDEDVAVSVHVMGSGIEVELGLLTDVGEAWGAPFNPGEGWTRLDSVLTPPPGSTEGRLLIRLAGESITPSSSTGVTGAMVGATGTTFDGDSPDGDGIRYDWSGDPYASSSREIEEGETSGGDDAYCYDTTQGNSEGGPVTFTVRGDTCVSPTITLYGPLTSPIVENIATGETVGYAGTIADSDPPVVIDTEDGTAIQGGQSRTHLLTGDARLLLESGENTLRLISYQSTDSGHAEVCWRPVVLSI